MNKHSHQSLKSDFYLVWYWWYTTYMCEYIVAWLHAKIPLSFCLICGAEPSCHTSGLIYGKGSIQGRLISRVDLAASSHPISMKSFSFLRPFQLNFFYQLIYQCKQTANNTFLEKATFWPKSPFLGAFYGKNWKKVQLITLVFQVLP